VSAFVEFNSEVSQTIGRSRSAYDNSSATISSAGDGSTVVNLDEEVILHVQRAFDFLAQDSFVKDVLDADSDTIDLVGVGRADSSTRRSNLALTEESFGDLVERAVIRRDDVGA
jgi:hypothetical protein